ncbi:hypothetical protein [Chitinibacter sp. GC72]|uniref:hypothetical protein n=1 Tax=Chitinibacter sp. GC72 TaxID=1526917 RepID=UPI0012FA6A8D|nr:hypothetical protein [Chitinibacter sp. GC72]
MKFTFTLFLVFISTFAIANDYQAVKSLTLFESARVEAKACAREGDFKQIAAKYANQYHSAIDAVKKEGDEKLGVGKGSEYLLAVVNKVEQDVAKDHLPFVQANKTKICSDLNSRLVSILNRMK